MTTPVIMDVIVVMVLAAAVWYGARRGLWQALTGLVLVAAALIGAAVAAGALTDPVTEWVTPLVEQRMTERVETALAEQAPPSDPAPPSDLAEPEDDAWELLTRLGLDESLRSALAERVRDSVRETGATLVSAAAESLTRSAVSGVLFVTCFLVLLLGLKLLAGAMGLVLRLPGLSAVNALGGGVVGLIEGALLLFLAVWVCRRLGVSFETPPLSEAQILRMFTTHTPLSLWSFLL